MPRPTDLDPEFVAESEADFAELVANPPEESRWIYQSEEQRPYFREMHVAGDWLHQKLIGNGVSEEKVKKINFAFGQMCFGRSDPWEVAEKVLKQIEEGNTPKPGIHLADELIAETFGGELGDAAARRQELRQRWYDKLTTFED